MISIFDKNLESIESAMSELSVASSQAGVAQTIDATGQTMSATYEFENSMIITETLEVTFRGIKKFSDEVMRLNPVANFSSVGKILGLQKTIAAHYQDFPRFLA
jgi:N-acetyl-beta-hexosaminidase